MTRDRHMTAGMQYVTATASRNVMRRLVAARSAPGTAVLLTVIPPTNKSGREIWLVDAAATIPLPSPREGNGTGAHARTDGHASAHPPAVPAHAAIAGSRHALVHSLGRAEERV